MNGSRQKYSLWIVPSGEVAMKLQNLVGALADERGTPIFEPHLTLVGNVTADEQEVTEIKQKTAQLAKELTPFTIQLSAYGYLDEKYRALFLRANASELARVYQKTSKYFEQVTAEHFQTMPHISVMYDECSADTKDALIADHPMSTMEFTVDSIHLYLTNDPIESWKKVESFSLT